MPIRFRCAYCNQLLGIARRKAGQVVRCPTCAGQVVVPQNDELPPDSPQMEQSAPAEVPMQAPVFERDDFGLEFDEPVASMPMPGAMQPAPAAAAAPAAPWGGAPAHGYDVERYNPAVEMGDAPAGGIVLSPAKATMLTVLAILGMAIAFGAGLIVGRFMLG